jgi:hypothetical protein
MDNTYKPWHDMEGFKVIKEIFKTIGKTVWASRHLFLADSSSFVNNIQDIFGTTEEELKYFFWKIFGVIVGFIISIILIWELAKKIIRAIIKYYKKEKQNTEYSDTENQDTKNT